MRRGIAILVAVGALAVPLPRSADAAGLNGARLHAHCAGIADAAFGGALSRDNREEMDYFADEAHIFMALARRGRGSVPVGILQQLRVEGAAQLFHDDATDDSIHALMQECSDARQALMRAGTWREDPAR